MYLAGTFGAIFMFWHKLANSNQLSITESVCVRVCMFAHLLSVLDLWPNLCVCVCGCLHIIDLRKICHLNNTACF